MEKITYRKTLDVHKNGIQFTLQGFETADKLSRRIEINLTASGDTYELPLEGVVALMYITTPNSEEPSIEECTIKDNTVVYDVLPIVEEGITEMQLKLIGTNYDGARAVLVSPRFAVEVTKSNAEDESAEQTTTFTALENAVAKANAIYNARLTKVEFDDLCIFRAYYADGTVYETDAVQKHLLQVTTDIDLTALVKDGLTNFTADEVAEELDERYRDAFAKAIYSNNLGNTYDVPTFVRWDSNTANTPYKAGFVNESEGWAVCYGDTLNHTAVAYVKGEEGNSTYIRRTINGNIKEWQAYITEQGGTINGSLELKKDLVLSDDTARKVMLKKVDDSVAIMTEADEGNYSMLSLSPDTDAVKVKKVTDGESEEYKLFGENNLPHPAQIYSDTYEGTGEGKDAYDKTITAPFKPQVVYLASHIAVRPSKYAYRSVPNMITECDVTWGETDNTITFKRKSGFIADSGTKFNVKGKVYSYIIIGY